MSLFNPSREDARRFFCQSWRKYRAGMPLSAMEQVVADLISEHPEYHALIESEEAAVERDFLPEGGAMNPFLHLSLHLAVAEQLSVDQPTGIRAAYEALRTKRDVHAAEHLVMECLAEALWYSQRHQTPLDGFAYLAAVQKHC